MAEKRFAVHLSSSCSPLTPSEKGNPLRSVGKTHPKTGLKCPFGGHDLHGSLYESEFRESQSIYNPKSDWSAILFTATPPANPQPTPQCRALSVAETRPLLRSRAVVDDAREIFCHQTSSTDQCAVDFGFGNNFVDVARFD